MADELFQASTSQLSFEKFINTINQEQARDLVRRINQFMKAFSKRAPESEADAREVQDFLTSMELAISRHPLWAGSTRTELDNAVEGLEKYLMTKLYDRTFAADPLDRERDAVLSRRLTALAGFVAPAHLEVSAALAGPLAADESGQLVAAERELRRMHLYKSPREKLVEILNCCKIINTLINSKRAGAGADDFTPTLIYVTIKAQPEALASNLAFIERYRHGPRLNGEAAYFFVQMQGAVAFLETLTTSSLAGCDPDEFISHMLAAGAMSEAELSEEQLAVQRQRAAAAAALPPPSRPPPPPQSIAAGAAGAAAAPPSAAPAPAAASAAPVYGNPMLSGARQPPPPPLQQQPYVATTGVYGSGTPLPPPPPPPLSALPQQPPYFMYPAANTGPQPYGQMMMAPYYGQVPYAVQQGPAMVYGEAWSAAQLQQQGMMAPPPPPPPPPASAPPAATGGGPGSSSPLAPSQPPIAAQSIPPPPKSVAELEADGVRLVVRAEAAGELRARYRYLYTSPEALSLRNVAQLLAAYKELVLRYETLAQAVENNVLKYYSELEAYQAGLRSTPPGTAATTPPPPPLLPHLPHPPSYNSGTRTAPAAPPSSPPAPQQVMSPLKQQFPPSPAHEESELVSKRGAPPPPPPPPPAVAPTPPSLSASGPSGGGGAAAISPRRTVDLSQFMPDYQLLTEGYAFGAMAPSVATTVTEGGPEREATSTTAASAAAANAFPLPPEAAASLSPYQGSSTLMAMDDLLGDEAPAPPPPPPLPPVLLIQIALDSSTTTGPSAPGAAAGAAPASPGAAAAATGSTTSDVALHGQSWNPQDGLPEPVLSSTPTSNNSDTRGSLQREGWQASQQQQDEAEVSGLQQQQEDQLQQSQQHMVLLTLAPNSNQQAALEDVRVTVSGNGPAQDDACAVTPSGGGGAAVFLTLDPPTDDDEKQLTLTLTPHGSSLTRSDADLVSLASLNNRPAGGGGGGAGAGADAVWGAGSVDAPGAASGVQMATAAYAASVEAGPSTIAAAEVILEASSAAVLTSAGYVPEDNGSSAMARGTSSHWDGTSSAMLGVAVSTEPFSSAALGAPMSERPVVEKEAAGAALQQREGSSLLSESDVGGDVAPAAEQTVGHGGESASSCGQGVGSVHVPALDSHPAGMLCHPDHTLGAEREAVNVPSSVGAHASLTAALGAVGVVVGDPAAATSMGALTGAQIDLGPQSEAERQARVDELLQQLLGTGGDGGQVSSAMMDDTTAYDAASLDAMLALYGAEAVEGLADATEVGPSGNSLLGDINDVVRGTAMAAALPQLVGTANAVTQGSAYEALGVTSTVAMGSEAAAIADDAAAEDEQSLFAGLHVQNCKGFR